jgi:uncharacterized YccA/Bax inhibitor family protein
MIAIASTTNPIFRNFPAPFHRTSHRADESSRRSTLAGALQKGTLLTLCTAAVSLWIWNALTHVNHSSGSATFEVRLLHVVLVISALTPFALVGLSLWRKSLSPYTAPAYATLQGAFFGFFAVACEHRFPGVVMQSICLSCAVCFTLGLAYLNGFVATSTPFRRKVLVALSGVPIYFVAAFLLTNLGLNVLPIVLHGRGAAISGIVAIIAASTFVSVFDLAASNTALDHPAYMEWHAALGLVVSLVWLYMEGLRLFIKDRIPSHSEPVVNN